MFVVLLLKGDPFRRNWENWLQEGHNMQILVTRVPNMRGSDLIPEGELRQLSQIVEEVNDVTEI